MGHPAWSGCRRKSPSGSRWRNSGPSAFEGPNRPGKGLHEIRQDQTIPKHRKEKGMKKFFVWAVLVLFLFVSGPALAQTGKPSGEPIKIGGSLGLTGVFAEQSKWIKGGYDAWVEEINQKGGLLGRPVKLIMYEDEGNTDKAVTF